MTQTTVAQVHTETWGDVPRHTVRFAADRVGSLLTWASEPVKFARIKLTMIADPAVQRPAIAQVTVDLNGRDVVRRKSSALDRETPEEAAAEAELMDYHFHLFTERSTGQDGVICRTVGGYRLQLAVPPVDGLGPVDESILVSEVSAPRRSLSETAALLEASGQPFLFFVDAETGRGNVLYHRYDGHYGLIVPSAD